MARLALKNKTAGRKAAAAKSVKAGKKVVQSTKVYNRCTLCGRNHGYMRKFDMCRICFRELALDGKLPGIKKCSW